MSAKNLKLVPSVGVKVSRSVKKYKKPHLMMEFVDVKIKSRVGEGVQVFSARAGEAIADELKSTKQRIAEGTYTIRVYRNKK